MSNASPISSSSSSECCVEAQPDGAEQEPGGDVEGGEEHNEAIPARVDDGREEIPAVADSVTRGHVEVLHERATAGSLHESPASRVHLDRQLSGGSYEVNEVGHRRFGAPCQPARWR